MKSLQSSTGELQDDSLADCKRINLLDERVKHYGQVIGVLSDNRLKVSNEFQTTNSNLEALDKRLQGLEKKATANGWDNPDQEVAAVAGRLDPKL